MHDYPHPTWLTELVGQAIMKYGLNLAAVQQYVAERAPADAQLSPDMVAKPIAVRPSAITESGSGRRS
ncbi:MAG: hypothetical protein ACUVS4_04300 [Chloroflexaceae bacterium]